MTDKVHWFVIVALLGTALLCSAAEYSKTHEAQRTLQVALWNSEKILHAQGLCSGKRNGVCEVLLLNRKLNIPD